MTKWIKVKTTDSGFQYAERLGIDTVSFVPFRYTQWGYDILINDEYYQSYNRRVHGAFNGSIDEDISLTELVIKEMKEEAGHEVGEKNIMPLGSIISGFPSNSMIHLFAVDITNSKSIGQNLHGLEDINTYWVNGNFNDIVDKFEDPRLITILARLNLKKNLFFKG